MPDLMLALDVLPCAAAPPPAPPVRDTDVPECAMLLQTGRRLRQTSSRELGLTGWLAGCSTALSLCVCVPPLYAWFLHVLLFSSLTSPGCDSDASALPGVFVLALPRTE